MWQLRVVAEVCSVLQPDVLRPAGEVAGDPSEQAGLRSHSVQFILKHKKLDGVKGT